ncbi:MAG TPA: Crp/Fnr family transcriptional regulator [Gemmatimonadaceae bacterium]|nr:Crp/Fnr family transcriptional regulator [Gemmatimonadaceae bacterium]
MKEITRLSREQRESIAKYGARTFWPAGFAIYEQGAIADGVFIVVRGQVALRNPVASGRSFVPWVATPGETFGGEGLETEARYASQARAEDETETLHLSTARFSALMREQPAYALALVRQLMAERTEILDKFGQYATLTVEQRLVAALVRMAQSREVPADVAPQESVVVSRRLLGELVGATRESISLVLGRLSAEGLIQRAGNGLVIADLDGLVGRVARQGTAAQPSITLYDERAASGADARE